MTPHHLATIVWLRWRLAINRIRRDGIVSFVVSMILIGSGLLAGVLSFAFCLVFGVPLLADATPLDVLLTWDAVVCGFLFFWMTGIVGDLQRSELIGVDKFLHLPVSLGGVFLMNFLASFLSLSLTIFLPAMTGLVLALTVTRGPMMLVTFLPIAGLVFAMTALTYQFRGWIAAMITDRRRRRFIVSLATMAVVLVAQAPNLLNLAYQRGVFDPADVAALRKQLEDLDNAEGTVDPHVAAPQRAALHAALEMRLDQTRHDLQRWVTRSAWLVNALVPIGWLPYSAAAATEGRPWPALIAFVTLSAIGGASLRRSYLTTVRMHTGGFSTGKAAPTPTPPTRPATNRPRLVERRIPGLSEQASAVATATLRSFLRAPEAKIMLMSPVIMVVIFSVLIATRTFRPETTYRPLVAFGALASAILGLGQVVINPFGFDRAGFRALVLSSAPRRDILLGKNVAIAPIVLALQAALILILEIMMPLRIDHFLAVIPQAATMFVLFCLLSNLPAIWAPSAIAAGSLRPTSSSGTSQFIRLGFALMLPFVLAIALLPHGIEVLLAKVWHVEGPFALMASLVLAGVAVLAYRVAIGWEGELLERRELEILAVVAAKVE